MMRTIIQNLKQILNNISAIKMFKFNQHFYANKKHALSLLMFLLLKDFKSKESYL